MTIISVIIPYFKTPPVFFKECLHSLKLQELRNSEFILISDGAENELDEISKKFIKIDNRFHLIVQDHKGVSAARNTGLKAATGKYVIFVDSDDTLHPSALVNMVNFMNDHPVDFARFGAYSLKNKKQDILFQFDNHIEKINLRQMQGPVWSYIFKNDLIKKDNLFFKEDLSFSEDKVFVTSYTIASKYIGFSQENVYYYRTNPNSTCNKKQDINNAINQIKAAGYIKEILSNTSLSQATVLSICNTIVRSGLSSYLTNCRITKTGIKKLSKLYYRNITQSFRAIAICWIRTFFAICIGKIFLGRK